MEKRICIESIDKNAQEFKNLAGYIWENPEMGWKEVNAAKRTAEVLKAHGFEVEIGAYTLPTAIRAVKGHGKPVIGFCGEYDCLPGLSQKVDTKKNPVVEGGVGHGCGHNLLGAGCVAACVGLADELERTGKEGTIIFYGCPAEEQLTGKGFMAKNGAFKECDFTIAWHPSSTNRNTYGTMNGVEGAIFHFRGKTSHAALNPQDGRSALDAVQLMNIGVEFLREHVTPDVRMHYQILEGGMAANIVPDVSSVKYFVRALSREANIDAYQRVVECAYGAARMTGTTLTIESLGGIYPTMQNRVLTDAMQRAREVLPLVEWTEEELKFADEINKTTPYYTENTKPISDQIVPLGNYNGGASTDYGDVMHIVPGVQNTECTAATLSGGHSWMITSCSGSTIGFKGMIRAAKVMALGAMDIIDHPELLKAAKEEFAQAMHGTEYVCPIGDDVAAPFKE